MHLTFLCEAFDFFLVAVAELLARDVRLGVQRFLPQLAGRRVLLREDNMAVVYIITNFVSRSPALMNELRKLWGVLDEYEFEGDKEAVLADAYQFNMACTLYGFLLENVTCEMASKMSAMENASNNATDMIGRLTLQYNRQRQAVITTELTEIVAGAESV